MDRSAVPAGGTLGFIGTGAITTAVVVAGLWRDGGRVDGGSAASAP